MGVLYDYLNLDKRKWGYNHTNLKGLEKVNGEMALIMTVYNLKRAMNILGIEKLIEKLKTWKPDYKKVACLLKTARIRGQIRRLAERRFWSYQLAA